MTVAAFCPAYITGIFTIAKGDAAGAGFAIGKGMTTAVSEAGGKTTITINGSKSSAPVSRAVLRKYCALCGKFSAAVSHKTPVPIGYGLGMSAAGALSLSLALNGLLGAGLRDRECIKIAHDADVECGTGLSGVDAAAIGGMLARKSVKEAPVKVQLGEKELEIAFFSPIRTASVIRSGGWKGKVNRAGNAALSRLFSDLEWENFVSSSRQFAKDSGLAHWCRKEMESNGRAGMAMLGRTLFSDRKLSLCGKPIKMLRAKTSQEGAGLV